MSDMKTRITSVKVFPFNGVGKVKAFASITINDLISIKGFKVVDGRDGMFIGKPSSLNKKEDKWYNDIYIVDADKEGTPGRAFDDYLTKTVLDEYAKTQGPAETDDGVPF